MPHFITPDFVCMSSLLALNEKKSNTKQCPCAVKKVLADLAVYVTDDAIVKLYVT